MQSSPRIPDVIADRITTALDRLTQISSQLAGSASSSGKAKLLEKNPDDVRCLPTYPLYPYTLVAQRHDKVALIANGCPNGRSS